jgi:hypothetical protein
MVTCDRRWAGRREGARAGRRSESPSRLAVLPITEHRIRFFLSGSPPLPRCSGDVSANPNASVAPMSVAGATGDRGIRVPQPLRALHRGQCAVGKDRASERRHEAVNRQGTSRWTRTTFPRIRLPFMGMGSMDAPSLSGSSHSLSPRRARPRGTLPMINQFL